MSQWFKELARERSLCIILWMSWPICQSERTLGDVSCLWKAMLRGQRGSVTGQSWWPRGGSHKPGKPGQCACWHFSFLISHKYFSFNRASVQMKRNFFVSWFCYIMFENSYQPPNYPFKDKLAKLFPPPSHPSFYKQKGTLTSALFPLGKWSPHFFLSGMVTFLPVGLRDAGSYYCSALPAHSQALSDVQASRLDPRRCNCKG